MPDFRFQHQIEIRYSDLDTLGHVNNVKYLSFMETARFVYTRQIVHVENTLQPGIVVASVTCNYRSPAYFGEQLRVAVRVAAVGRRSFTLAYRISTADNRLVADGTSVQVTIDAESGRSKPLPEEWRAGLLRELGHQAEVTRPELP